MLSQPPTYGPDGQLQLHASTVVFNGHAVALCGPSGSGKSTTALRLIALGGTLLADDITWLIPGETAPIATCPPHLSGLIEARGVGLLNAPSSAPAILSLVVDLGVHEPDRLPPRRTVTLMGHDVALLWAPRTVDFAYAIAHIMVHGRAD